MRYALQCIESINKQGGIVSMQAYYIKCVNLSLGTEAISTRLFYWYDQAIEIVDTLNAKNDGYRYSVQQANI